jgi:hypothetical protein
VIEDKQLGVDDGEYQIPGEILAVVYHNYVVLGLEFSQTIFAMRIIGMKIFNTFRAWIEPFHRDMCHILSC